MVTDVKDFDNWKVEDIAAMMPSMDFQVLATHICNQRDELVLHMEALKTARELNQELRDTMWHQKGCMEAELKSLKETIKGDTSDINNLRNYIRDQELYVARMEGYLTRIQDQEGSNKDAVIGRHALSSQDVAEDYKASIPLTQRYGPRKWFEVK